MLFRSPRNAQAARFLDDLGFDLVAENADGGRAYCLGQDADGTLNASFVSIRWEGEPIHV